MSWSNYPYYAVYISLFPLWNVPITFINSNNFWQTKNVNDIQKRRKRDSCEKSRHWHNTILKGIYSGFCAPFSHWSWENGIVLGYWYSNSLNLITMKWTDPWNTINEKNKKNMRHLIQFQNSKIHGNSFIEYPVERYTIRIP